MYTITGTKRRIVMAYRADVFNFERYAIIYYAKLQGRSLVKCVFREIPLRQTGEQAVVA